MVLLRRDEQFVVERLAAHFEGTWREGENPPDAYLTLEGQKVPVEITTLVQFVAGRDGNMVSRMSQDETALKLADTLDEQLRDVFPENRAAFLILSSPIDQRRKLQSLLRDKLLELATSRELPVEPIDFIARGNHVIINIHFEWEPGRKRVAAAV